MTLAQTSYDCSRLTDPDLGAIDRIARFQLDCARRGEHVRLINASAELIELINFAGLGTVLRIEAAGQSKQGEQAGRIEEESELRDSPV
jgi:hypothetical protein